jgi:hypothetical protein
MSHPIRKTEQRASVTATRRRHAAEAVIAAYLRDISARRRAPRAVATATR